MEIGQIHCSERFMPLVVRKQLIFGGPIEILTKEGEKEVKMDAADVNMTIREGHKDYRFKGFEAIGKWLVIEKIVEAKGRMELFAL
ncbi:hypothetical protein WN943_003964 [Citrus x changshan-huyou]